MRIINGYRFALCSYTLNKMADVSERFSDTFLKNQKQAMSKSLPIIKRRRKKENIIDVSLTSDS